MKRRKRKRGKARLRGMLPFQSIKYRILRKFLIRLFESDKGPKGPEIIKLYRIKKEIEAVENQVRHVRSLVEILLLRSSYSK